ncbi:MAG: hypothetical protein K5634_03545 [Sphaerochaetaceae bacterium]|nr:hypothetical protein [Sphaerochaetaceae bacterium]
MKVYEYGELSSPISLIQCVDEHDFSSLESEISLIKKLTDRDFSLTAFMTEDWNRDLSPWKAPPVFGKEGFGGEAEKTLKEILEYCSNPDKTYIIGGYSLSALFSLWASCKTDVFKGTASASPSVWFPGFITFLKENPVKSRSVYLSLGDREEKTRNPVMATVGDCIRSCSDIFRQSGITTTLEWNPGNHFQNAPERTARAFSWVLNN